MSYLSVWNILQSRLWWRLIISIRKDAILLIYKLRKLKYSLVLPIYTEYSIWITIHLTKAPNLFWWSTRHHIRSKGEILDWGKVIGISIFFWSSSKLPHGLMKATQTSVLRRTATKRVVFWVTESNHFTLLRWPCLYSSKPRHHSSYSKKLPYTVFSFNNSQVKIIIPFYLHHAWIHNS